MTSLHYFGDGIRALRSWRMIVMLHLLTLLVWIPALLVFHASASETFGGSLVAEALLTNEQPDASIVLADFVVVAEPFDAAGTLVPVAMLMLLLLHVFLSGGIVEFAGREPRPFAASFFAACASRFFVYLRLLGIFVVLVVLIVGTWVALASGVSKAISAGGPPNLTAPRVVGIVAVVIAVLLFGLLSGVHDVARALLRFEPWRNARSAFADGWRIVRRTPLVVLTLFAGWLLIGAALQLLWLWAEWGPSPKTMLGIFGAAMALQGALLTRCATRVAVWGSMIALTADRVGEVQHVQSRSLAEVAMERWVEEEPEVEAEIVPVGRLQSAE